LGDYNKVCESLIEIPIKGTKCVPCDGSGTALVKEGEETVEAPCMICDGKGMVAKDALKLCGRLRWQVKADFEDWLEDTARRKVFDSYSRGKLDSNELKMSLDSVNRLVSSYSFRWAGDSWRDAMAQIPGNIKMYHLLMEDANRLLVEKGQAPQRWTEADFAEWLMDDCMGPMLRSAWDQIRDSSPNFLSPPIRGVDV
jgi:hypothetical protein